MQSSPGISRSKMIIMRKTVKPASSARVTTMIVRSWECGLEAENLEVYSYRKGIKNILRSHGYDKRRERRQIGAI